VSHEKEFPEGVDMKPLRGLISLRRLFFLNPHEVQPLRKMIKKGIGLNYFFFPSPGGFSGG
jgi:hypothetical protein